MYCLNLSIATGQVNFRHDALKFIPVAKELIEEETYDIACPPKIDRDRSN